METVGDGAGVGVLDGEWVGEGEAVTVAVTIGVGVEVMVAVGEWNGGTVGVVTGDVTGVAV